MRLRLALALVGTLLSAMPCLGQFYGGRQLTVYPLDGLPTPASCYGMVRLLSAYTTNKALDLTLSGTTQTIGFVNGKIDSATGDSFCGGSSSCYVTKWYDQCGTNDASRAAGSTAPLWYSGNSVNGLRSVIFPLATDGVGLDLSTFAWTPGNPTTIISAGQPLASQGNQALFMTTTGASEIYIAANSGGCNASSCGPPSIALPSVAYSTTPAEVEPSILSVQWQGGTANFGSNDQSSSASASAQGAKTGASIGAGTGSLLTEFDSVGFLIYTSYLNSAQISAINAKLAKTFGVTTSYSNVVVQDGDSFSQGYGSTFDNSYLRFALQGTKYPIRAYNNAVVGEKLSAMVSQFTQNVGAYYKAGYTTFIVHILGGANDIRASVSEATIYANLQTYVNDVHALGSNAKVIVATNPVQCDIYQNGAELAELQTYNNAIIANWNVPQASGGLGADGLDNLWANTTIGPGNYTSSAFCGYPNTYSIDGMHPTDLSDSILGPIEAASLNTVLP